MLRVFPEPFCVTIPCVASVSSLLPSQHHSSTSLARNHPHRKSSCQRKSSTVPLVVSLWVEEWWARGRLTSCKTHVIFVHISLFLIFFLEYQKYSGWGYIWSLKTARPYVAILRGCQDKKIWCKFHWKRNLLPKGSPLQVSSDMKTQLSPQYWTVHCKQRDVSTHLVLMGCLHGVNTGCDCWGSYHQWSCTKAELGLIFVRSCLAQLLATGDFSRHTGTVKHSHCPSKPFVKAFQSS